YVVHPVQQGAECVKHRGDYIGTPPRRQRLSCCALPVILSAAKNLRVACHSEHSEESACGRREILRCAQNDNFTQILSAARHNSLAEILRCAQNDTVTKYDSLT